MAKLYFRYGAMNCGKSAALMLVAHNYEEQGMKVLLVKPAKDTKGNDKVVSRIGLERKVDVVLKEKDELLKKIDVCKYNCILVDEAQFLKGKQVDELFKITKLYDIPVITYGLRTDFTSYSFEGSKRLLELSDSLEELITICECGKKARFSARRLPNGKYTNVGEQVVIDGTSEQFTYVPVCGKCYYDKVLRK